MFEYWAGGLRTPSTTLEWDAMYDMHANIATCCYSNTGNTIQFEVDLDDMQSMIEQTQTYNAWDACRVTYIQVNSPMKW